MWFGPIHPTLPGLGSGHSPVKKISVTSTSGATTTQVVLFDQEYGYSLQPGPVDIDADTSIYEASPANALARLTQIIELSQNSEWQRCGVFIQWREDGTTDPEDGWYIIRPQSFSEEFLFSSYAEPTISVELRARQRTAVGVYTDAKALPNDANLSGVGLAALPMGMSSTFPVTNWTFPGLNGNIFVWENPTSVMRAGLNTPTTVMTQGRCMVTDEAT